MTQLMHEGDSAHKACLKPILPDHEVFAVRLSPLMDLDDDQLQEASGIRYVEPDDPDGYCYVQGACIPTGQWRNISGQIRQVDELASANPNRCVGFFDLNKELKVRIAKRILALRQTPPSMVVSDSIVRDIAQEVRRSVRERFHFDSEDKDYFGLNFNSPGLETVTIDRERGHKIGLHFDSWRDSSMRGRLEGRQRIVVNLGPAARWFLYVPIPLESIVSSLPQASDPARSEVNDIEIPSLIGNVLIGLGAPVHCLKINPGQGYVAPTEAIVHDATTRWATESNLHVLMLGALQWLPQPKRSFEHS